MPIFKTPRSASKPAPRPAPTPLRPGTPTPQSGQYVNTTTKNEVTSTQGNPLPPGPKGSKFILVDATKHQNG
jgi:hypothetical protein